MFEAIATTLVMEETLVNVEFAIENTIDNLSELVEDTKNELEVCIVKVFN